MVSAAACIALMVCAGVCVGIYRSDCARLDAIARAVIADAESPAEKVERLNHWVFNQGGFRKNPAYFLISRFRATPVQVLERGGDCADKSRLLWSLLRRIDIPATMAMCFDPQTRAPVHTVVEARIGPTGEAGLSRAMPAGEAGMSRALSSEFMVADPVYNLTFPKPNASGYFGLLELRQDPIILQNRLTALSARRPRGAPIHAYRGESAVYDHASTINWNKNAALRAAFSIGYAVRGEQIYRMRRPTVLEEPQLAAGLIFFIGSLVSAAGFAMAGQGARQEIRAPGQSPVTSAPARRLVPTARMRPPTPQIGVNLPPVSVEGNA